MLKEKFKIAYRLMCGNKENDKNFFFRSQKYYSTNKISNTGIIYYFSST